MVILTRDSFTMLVRYFERCKTIGECQTQLSGKKNETEAKSGYKRERMKVNKVLEEKNNFFSRLNNSFSFRYDRHKVRRQRVQTANK